MLRCTECSHESATGSRFCPHCAAPLSADSAETVVMGLAPSSHTSVPLSSTSTVDEGRFLPGVILAGRYRIAGLLGRGGMGEVYRATDLTLGQAVALKFLPEAASRDDRALARFYNEVRVARQVTHPNVCRVYDVGQVEGLHYISMEYVAGEDLSCLLRRIGRLPADKAVEAARQLCAGLAAAHDKGVLHRDLKPANVMIDSRGQVVVMDFGLAGLSEQLQGDVRSGTPAYMSPEQLAGTEVTTKSDIYSLGLVLYELFTGKRAFEASSLMELMQMQEHAKPASLTTLVHELDPTVERVVLRCLSADPRLRPQSALAVAAALPGGDPLAAALAAGETPSPQLLAAAGETEGLQAVWALGWLAAVIVGIIIVGILGAKLSILDRIPLELPPDALVRDARNTLADLGYAAKPADSGWGFQYASIYKAWLNQHPAQAPARWKEPAKGFPPLIEFWYIQSPHEMVAERHFNTELAFHDPPLESSGMVRLFVDPQGKLLHLEAVPLQVEEPLSAPAAPYDWAALFHAAGLNQSQFQPTEAKWTPLANWDARAAWTGADAITGSKLRVEAAAWRGKPVSFRIIGPWTQQERMLGSSGNQFGSQTAILIVVYLALVSSCVIAWYNFRSGRVDQRGALIVGGLYFLGTGLGRLLAAHHAANLQELSVFWKSITVAALNGAVVWLFYVALEPWVRRHWPRTMITWSRFTTQGLRDPLVGRDALYSCGLGCVLALLTLARFVLRGSGGEPLMPALEPLLGARIEVADGLQALASALFSPIMYFFLLFLCRMLFRKEWLAAIIFGGILTVIFSSGTSYPATDIPMAALMAVFYVMVLLRLGLLALIVSEAMAQFLTDAPHTLDFSSWYFGLGIAPLLFVGLVAYGAFRTSLGGRKILRAELF